VLVKDIVAAEVVSVSTEQSMHDAVTAMHRNEKTCCLLVDDGIPSGVITEHDALDACRRSGRPLERIPLAPFATGFEVTVSPHKTVYYAVGMMVSHELEVLPVKEGLEIVGMITQEQIMENLTNLTRETISNLGQGHKWNA
jgi:signal-transduction protein with cAMP-binding, CBS, and nucleotidyltransferase domain